MVDNVSTHKTPEIKRWLVRHPRFHLHFTPTYCLVERWFAELTNKWLRRGTHRSIKELESAIDTWINRWNEEPRPFVWHKSADEILGTLANYCTRISDSGHYGHHRTDRPAATSKSPDPLAAGPPARNQRRRLAWARGVREFVIVPTKRPMANFAERLAIHRQPGRPVELIGRPTSAVPVDLSIGQSRVRWRLISARGPFVLEAST